MYDSSCRKKSTQSLHDKPKETHPGSLLPGLLSWEGPALDAVPGLLSWKDPALDAVAGSEPLSASVVRPVNQLLGLV